MARGASGSANRLRLQPASRPKPVYCWRFEPLIVAAVATYYGSPKVHRDLREQGIRVSRKRVAQLMRQHGLRGRCRRRRLVCTTESRHALPVAPNLLARRFTPSEVGRLNRFWCGDITYVATNEGWQYLAIIQDLFSRRVIGWAMSDTLETSLVHQAWQQALRTRGFVPGQGPHLYHSDRGSQYASHLFQEVLAQSSGTGPNPVQHERERSVL